MYVPKEDPLDLTPDYCLRSLEQGEKLEQGRLYCTGDHYLLSVRGAWEENLRCDLYRHPKHRLASYEIENTQEGVEYSPMGEYIEGSEDGECDVQYCVVFEGDQVPQGCTTTTYHKLLRKEH